MCESTSVALTVNGTQRSVPGSGDGMLIFALREGLGLFGVRPGCSIGACGSCTVLVDDVPVRSCVTPVDQVVGSEIVTPEGLGGPARPHPVQQAFIDAQAAQCGYCVNGMIMTVAGLVRRGERTPSRADLRAALAEHICRCGTHARLLQAACRAVGADPGAGEGNTGICDATSSCLTVRSEPATGPAAVEAFPPEVERAPSVEDWLALGADGQVVLSSGRSEIGQGVHAALRQVVAAQIEIPAERVVVHTPRTDESPDEDYTSGSRSMQQGAIAVAMAAVAMRRLMLARAAEALDLAAERLSIDPRGAIADPASGREIAFSELAAQGALTGEISLADQPRWTGTPLGASVPREDLVAKLTGSAAYVHDLALPGMLHARLVLPPTYEAQLVSAPTERIERMPGVLEVVRDGRLLIVLAETEEQAVRAAAALEARVEWDDPGVSLDRDVAVTFRERPAQPEAVRADQGVDAALGAGEVVRASYSKPYQSHGSMAPSCAVARLSHGVLTVWSSTQGVHQLAKELATIVDLDEEHVTVVHAYGPGCYGQNGADDAAAFASRAAQEVEGRPVRLQLSSADEFGWEPHGTAMIADVEASLDDVGCVRAWRYHVLTDTHNARPRGQGNRLAVSWLRDGGHPRPWLAPGAGGRRNAVPLYDIPAVESVVSHVEGPLRTGSLRSLGAFFNVFAIESFMDELAEAAGSDPLAFRLAHLRDPRSREVLETAAKAAEWQPHVGPSGNGQGLAVGRYHDDYAYVATVAEVDVDFDTNRITVRRLVIAADAGKIVHAEQLRQQVEGAALQGLSRTLLEQLRVDAGGIRSRDWSTYPVLPFSEVPALEVILLDRPGHPPLGAGEAATPPVPGAVANAIDDAVGIRLRDLPLTTEAVQQRLLAMSEAETTRVLLD